MKLETGATLIARGCSTRSHSLDSYSSINAEVDAGDWVGWRELELLE